MRNKLLSINFLQDFRCFKKGTTIEFKDNLTLLVGDQGVGKSSILALLQKFKSFQDVIAIKVDGKIQTLSFDTEKDNPRTKGYIMNDPLYQVASIYSSHGEAILPLMKHIGKEKDKLIMIDEPESGLSIRSQYKLAKYFNKAIKNKCQLLIATHSIPIIESYKKVLNLETIEHQCSKDFINSQRK